MNSAANELGLLTKVGFGLSSAAAALLLQGCGASHSKATETKPVGAPPPYFVCESRLLDGDRLDVTVRRVNQATEVQTKVRHIAQVTLEFAGQDAAPQVLHPDDEGITAAKIPTGYSQPFVHATIGNNEPVLCAMNDISK